MKKIKSLLNNFKKLKLSDKGYAIYGSGPLGVRGIRDVKDLDIVVTDDLYQKLKEKYPKDSKKERIKLGEIEIYPIWAWGTGFEGLKETIDRAELIDGLRFVLLEDLIRWKEKMGRVKDFEDIELIKKYLKDKIKNPQKHPQ